MRGREERQYPGVPPRLKEVFQTRHGPPLYFVTANTWKRRSWLATPEIHTAFRRYAAKNAEAGRTIGRYVIMPDHVHFFVRLRAEDRLGTFVRLLKQALTKAHACSGRSTSDQGGEERLIEPPLQSEGRDSDAVALALRASRTEKKWLTEPPLQSEGQTSGCSGRSTSDCSVRRPMTRLWQPGFFDHVLRSDESYAEKWRYVVANPVRAGLATAAEEWPFQGEVMQIDRA